MRNESVKKGWVKKKEDLSAKHRRAYDLYMGSSDMTYDELAKVFDVKPGTIRRYVDRGEKISFQDRRLRNAK